MAVAPAKRILMLCHRIPYPPDKGDKIRSYRWLMALAEHYQVVLGAFIDDPQDWVHAPRLQALCADLLLLPLDPTRARLRALAGLLTGAPLTRGYYRDRRMQDWIVQQRRGGEFAAVLVYSSAVAQYVLDDSFAGVRRVVDFVDVDADKWRQYALRRGGLMGLVYRRESRTLLGYDRAVAQRVDASLFVSTAEAALFSRLTGVTDGVEAISNGVDSDYFSPQPQRAPIAAAAAVTICFTGAMDYWANVDAVTWFVRLVWPRVRDGCPAAQFYIVGSRPAPAVIALAGNGVVVTGRVADVRPYLQHARVVVAPMQIARGIQNKVLEAMAMARPVVLTRLAAEGLTVRDGREVLIADAPEAFANQVLALLRGTPTQLGEAARALVVRRYSWTEVSNRLLRLIAGARTLPA